MLSQNPASLSSAALKGTSVFYNVGLGNPTNPLEADANVGLIEFDGFGSASVTVDENDSGKLSNQSMDLKYSVAVNGRVELVDPTSTDTVAVAYLVDKDTGFTMNLGSAAAAGFFEQQTGGPFSKASISGSYVSGTVDPAVTDSGVSSGVIASSGNGTLNGTLDDSHWASLLTTQQVSVQVTIGTDGRGTDTQGRLIFYVVSPKKVVLMNATSISPTISIFQR